MKKIIIVALTLALLLNFFACKEEPKVENTKTTKIIESSDIKAKEDNSKKEGRKTNTEKKSVTNKKKAAAKKVSKPKKEQSNSNKKDSIDTNLRDREFDIEIDEFVDLGTYCASCGSEYKDGKCPRCGK